jgi:hypothetical protein
MGRTEGKIGYIDRKPSEEPAYRGQVDEPVEDDGR